jgi:DNA-binding MarR family transcriptional regulator
VRKPDPRQVQRWEDVSNSTGHLLRLARQKWGAEWNKEAGQGLTTPQFTVLALLAANDELDQQTIGARAGLDKSTLGGMVERLETIGLVSTRVDPESRRRKLVGITATGLAALDGAAHGQQVVHARMVSPLSSAEETELRRLLRLIVDAEQKVNPRNGSSEVSRPSRAAANGRGQF